MKTFIDIGSNKLQGYRKFVDMLGIDDSWQKIFIEPNPENYIYLFAETIKIPNSIFLPMAVTETGRPIKLVTRSDREGDIAATTRGVEYLEQMLKRFDQRTDGYNTYDVDGITLWKVLDLVDGDEIYIKMDCEGAEYGILYNFPFYICPKIKGLWVEFHDDHDISAIERKFLEYGITINKWE
jgi:FkbM family methyltransferase